MSRKINVGVTLPLLIRWRLDDEPVGRAVMHVSVWVDTVAV